MSCETTCETMENMLDLYNRMIADKDVIYYVAPSSDSFQLTTFEDVNFEKIEKLFDAQGKEHFFNAALNQYFSNEAEGIKRCQHAFSLYLLGIYCYKNIPAIRNAFNSFLDKIYQGYNAEIDANETREENNYFKNFKYLWYPTALYHDMGYYFETQEDESRITQPYSDIIRNERIMDRDNLGYIDISLGVPKNIKDSVTPYFKKRLDRPGFSDKCCVDHGFAGGLNLYNQMKHVHCHDGASDTATYETQGFKYGKPIFKWFNTSSSWAVLCHNIYMAEEGTPNEKKYIKEGLGYLIYQKEHSLINYYEHPLLFLLDFVDTIDPFKQFELSGLKNTEIGIPAVNSLRIKLVGCRKQYCPYAYSIIKKEDSDLGFLKSDSFEIQKCAIFNSISFFFK